MPFARDTLSTLRAQAQSDVAAALPGANPLLRYSNLGILADVLAEGVNGAYGYLDWIARQAVPFTAVDEAFEGWAALVGVTRKPAVAATGQGTFTGVTGATLPANTPVSCADQSYLTTADGVVGAGGSVTVDLVASAAGVAGSLLTGAPLVLVQAVAGIASTGVATAGTAGVDVEPFEDFRTRVLAIFAQPPQGGSKSDYVAWAKEVPGVTRAWCTANGMGVGTAVVHFMMDDAQAAFGGFPQGTGGVAADEPRDAAATGDPLTVADYIYDRQPVTALVYALVPQKNTVSATIVLPGVSAELKTAIGSAIDQVFLVDGAPGGVVNLSRIEAAIAALTGAAGFVITAIACDHGSISPATGNITSAAGYLPVRGVLTWA